MRSGVARNTKVARELAGGRATLGLVQPITAAVLAGAILAGPLAQNGFDAPLDSGVRVQSLAGRSSCALWTAAEQLARLARVPLAFEQTVDCPPARWTRRSDTVSQSLAGVAVRQAFDQLTEQTGYRWVEHDGIAILRPASAWEPGGSVLNRPVSPIRLTSQPAHNALHVVFQAAEPPLFEEHIEGLSIFNQPVTMRFDGGTLVEALNAVASSFAGSWQAGYVKTENGQRRLVVALYTTDGPMTLLSSRSIRLPRGQ